MIVVDLINLSTSADTLLRERVLAMRRAGIDNRILCMDGPRVATLRAAGIPVEVVDLPRGLDPRRLVTALVQVTRYLRAHRVDVVHTHCSVPGAVGRIAAWLARVPVVIHTVHGFHFQDHMPWHRRVPSRLAEQLLGRLTDTLLTQNREDLALAERHGIGPPGRRGYVGNGIDLERFQPRPRPHATLDGRPVVLCVARFEPVKNHALLIDAAARLKARGASFLLRLAGTGELEERCRADVRARGLSECVEFLGYRDDVAELLAEADVAVLASRKEGLPRAVLEAMAMGLPVVGTRVPGTREAIRHGETGFLVDPDDPPGFAEALDRLLLDPEIRATFGARARAIALASYDEKAIAESLRKLYLTRVRARRPGADSIPSSEVRHERLGSPSVPGR